MSAIVRRCSPARAIRRAVRSLPVMTGRRRPLNQAAQHTAVTKYTPRPLVERPHGGRILEQSNHMVHVRCDDILEASACLGHDIANCFFNGSSIKPRTEEIDGPR